MVEVVEKVEEKAEEVKDTRTPAEKAYAAVQAKRVSFPHTQSGNGSLILSRTAKAEDSGEGQEDPQAEGGGENLHLSLGATNDTLSPLNRR